LLDLNMGGMSGTEAIHPIKRLAIDTRVFIMTIFYDSIELARARTAGAAGFLLKRDDWDETIERLCDESADWTAEAPAAPVPQPAQRPLSVLPTIEYCRT
jgi:DNA-binding NarL/FixJ family response regulator